MQKQKDIDLVLNPNTSIEMLLELGLEYPNELLQNPVFPFLFRHNCEFIHCQLHNNEHLKYLKDRGHFLSFRYCRWE